MSTLIYESLSQLCQKILVKHQEIWDEFCHDMKTEYEIGSKGVRVSVPEHLTPLLACIAPHLLQQPALLIAPPSVIDRSEQWGIEYTINDQLSEQELDGTISTLLSRSMHALLSKRIGSYAIPDNFLDISIPSPLAYAQQSIELLEGQPYTLSECSKQLVAHGYTRYQKQSSEYGFVILGDTIRITHPLFSQPITVSFFGNAVDSITSSETGRAMRVRSITVPPMKFPKETAPLSDVLKNTITIGTKEFSPHARCSIITESSNPDISLDPIVFDVQLPQPEQKKKSSRTYSSPVSRERALELIAQLAIGKPAVHADHGIGIYEGLEKRILHDAEQEYIVLRYADGDTLSVPVAFAHKVSPYVGESTPTLYRLGGTLWQKTKRKAQHDAAAFAKELMAINKKREQATRDSYHLDPAIEEQLITSFPYELTPDQVTTWDDIKKDMQNHIPMDRLVVGDVGFGKTEIAMRAARHAFANGKQVALLAPTTLLVQQHADTFRERLSDIASSIFLVSRFSSSKEIAQAKKVLESGKPAIIIGTHALLSSSMPWKNLSLLIIDEEQRFGVKQKEHLKAMRSTVDVLSLSATPIPRTLSMALSGLRSLSVIATAPKGRKNILTSIKKVSDEALTTIITEELERDGQIYIVAPKIRTLGMIKETVQALVPHARIAVAHAQLQDKTLSDIIHKFDTHEIDILISSSIVENGLDLPNANTMIVWNAPHFGLAQLYQLRGRIGRRSRQGHALFLYSQEKLTSIQRERLTALTEASRIGSGWEIARRDLEMRGAGNVLGAEQSGSASAVGMYLYLDMVDGVEDEERADIPTLLPSYIPTSYISETDVRTNWYIKLSRSDSQERLYALLGELTEQFGPIPEEVENLGRMILLQKAATKSGITHMQTSTIAPSDEDSYVRLSITAKDPVAALAKLSAIHNTDGSPARWQVRERTLSWDTDTITQELVDTLIFVLQ